MTARLWTALVLLAGVFALHGVQCLAGGPDLPAGHVADPAAMVAAPPGHAPTAAQGETGGTVASVVGWMSGPPATVTVTAAPADAGHGGAPHDVAGHLWTVCMAVLAVGLAVLLAVLVPRTARRIPRVLARARVSAVDWLPPPRPPDLSALCLLRI